MAPMIRLRHAAALTAIILIGRLAAGGDSADLVIRGTVEPVCEIAIVDYGTQLDLARGEQQRPVGLVTESCNAPDGYTISYRSARSSLKSASDRSGRYQLNHGPILHTGPVWQFQYELTVDISPQPELPAGAYEDTLQVTIQAN